MKRILSVLIVVLILISCVPTGYAANKEIQIKEYNDLQSLIKEQSMLKNDLHQKANALREIGYTDDSMEIQLLKYHWHKANVLYKEYKNTYMTKYVNNDDFWTEEMKQYPTATYVWRYLKGLMYSDEICAGIIGNMMIECAGGTLNLNWNIYDASGCYYGLCQWSKSGYPMVQGKDLKTQMNVLRDSIKFQIDYAGFVYGGKGFDYEDFLKISDPGEAALCFAKAYERCAAQYVAPRAKYAKIAYDYFVK